MEWWDIQRPHFDLFVSLEVIAELKNPHYPRSVAALAWISGMPLLPITDEVRHIAQLLIAEFLMPQVMSGDAIHAAVAAHHGMNHILSWNVQHLANPNKRAHFSKVLGRLGIMAPEITTPELLTED